MIQNRTSIQKYCHAFRSWLAILIWDKPSIVDLVEQLRRAGGL